MYPAHGHGHAASIKGLKDYVPAHGHAAPGGKLRPLPRRSINCHARIMVSVEKPVSMEGDLPVAEVKPEVADTEQKEQKDVSENDEDAEESSSESSDSGASYSTIAGGGAATCNIGVKFNLIQTDENGNFLCVSCAENEAKFYLNRFSRGSIGKCILFNDKWLTPNEFQAVSGRQSSKDWKRSIRLRGRCLKEYIYQGLFQEHVKACACRVCCGKGIEHTEGEVTLAPKRRKLSNGECSHHSNNVESTPLKTSTAGTSEKKRGRPPKTQKVWSPSGGKLKVKQLSTRSKTKPIRGYVMGG